MDKILVLVIEDESELNNILSEVLIMHNYEVVRAYNGQQAIDLIVKNNIKPALVLCDMNMPVMNGMDFIKQSLLHNLDLNICLVTGNSETSFVIEALQLGAIDYISKPFKLNILLEKIELMVDIGKRKLNIRSQLDDNMMVHNSMKMNNLLRIKNSQKKD